jgi:thiamine-phosphate pyrophosphorylase
MSRRQRPPERWLIIANRMDGDARRALRKLPLRSGVLVLGRLKPDEARHLRHLACLRQLTVALEAEGVAARVHNMVELRKAFLRRTSLVFLSPIYRTNSHPDWAQLHPMRAATLARLGGRKLGALGGLDARKFRRVKDLGFRCWGGISAFRS